MENKIEDFGLRGYGFLLFCFVLSLCHFKDEKHFIDMENKIEDFGLSGYGFYWLF